MTAAMRVRWRERQGLRDPWRRRFVCEIRKSEKRNGVQRKRTLVHLGTVHTGWDGAASREELVRFWRTAERKVRALRLKKGHRDRLLSGIRRRFRRPRRR